MITKEREDYLKAIYHLQKDESPVRTTTIAREMGVKPASVTGAIQRMAEHGFLDYQERKGVTLTEEGRRIALEVMRHHRLIELYLIEALGYSWDEVHDEAERLEHAVSPLFIERIAAALGHPTIDPHGAPIPTADGEIPPLSRDKLSEAKPGTVGTIARVNDQDPELLRYLADMDIRPGMQVTVLEVKPFGGPVHIQVNDATHAVGLQAAENIYLKASDD
ncbi:MAG: metal-dependent transcriptional regulator [Anaerolineae bacterium]